jgi:teichuronic acid biosynthesis glycosyltransferase TuaH
MISRQQHIIWLSGERWDRYAGSHRHMAVALAEHARILWVDPPISPATRTRQRDGQPRMLTPALTQPSDRITRLTPVVLPGFSRPGIRSTTARLIRAQVWWAVRKLKIQPSAVVMAYLGDLLGGWGEGVTNVLFGTDDYVAGAELMGLSAGYLHGLERRALARADVVVAVTQDLARRWSGGRARTVVIPNGCWPATGTTARRAPDAARLPWPVIGLVGHLADRIDFDVLDAIADAGFSLLLVGPRDPQWEPVRFSQLIDRPSVCYVGAVPSADVPSYLAAVDVGITPYRDTPFNRASFPLKTLEYLGAGLPVISADLPAARWLRSDLIRAARERDAEQVLQLASAKTGYVNAIRNLIQNYGTTEPAGFATAPTGWKKDLASGCIAFAERHSWPQRAETFISEIGLSTPGKSVTATNNRS